MAFMILFVFSSLNTVLGFVGYYCDIEILLKIFFTVFVLQAFMEFLKANYTGVGLYAAFGVMSYIIAMLFSLPPFKTICIVLCYINTIMLIANCIILLFAKRKRGS